MIFNPYQLSSLTDGTATAAHALPWAPHLLQDNVVVVGLLLLFIAVDLLACRYKGVMHHQLQWLADTRNSRTFESSVVINPWLKGVLLAQCFLSFGLTLFCLISDAPGNDLSHPDAVVLTQLVLCCLPLLAWFLLHLGLIDWFCYLYRLTAQRTIMNRTYLAGFVLLAPFTTLCLAGQISGTISHSTTINLLAALFILSQSLFIFNGIKIFYSGIGSGLLIFAYLCALEIAPLLMLWANFVTN